MSAGGQDNLRIQGAACAAVPLGGGRPRSNRQDNYEACHQWSSWWRGDNSEQVEDGGVQAGVGPDFPVASGVLGQMLLSMPKCRVDSRARPRSVTAAGATDRCWVWISWSERIPARCRRRQAWLITTRTDSRLPCAAPGLGSAVRWVVGLVVGADRSSVERRVARASAAAFGATPAAAGVAGSAVACSVRLSRARSSQRWPGGVAQHRDLVAQQQDVDFRGGVGAGEQRAGSACERA